MDVEWVLEILHTSQGHIQLASFSNTLTEMAGFGLVDMAARSAINSRIWNLQLQMARVVFGQNDIGQLERLLAEIPLSHDKSFWRPAH